MRSLFGEFWIKAQFSEMDVVLSFTFPHNPLSPKHLLDEEAGSLYGQCPRPSLVLCSWLSVPNPHPFLGRYLWFVLTHTLRYWKCLSLNYYFSMTLTHFLHIVLLCIRCLHQCIIQILLPMFIGKIWLMFIIICSGYKRNYYFLNWYTGKEFSHNHAAISSHYAQIFKNEIWLSNIN